MPAGAYTGLVESGKFTISDRPPTLLLAKKLIPIIDETRYFYEHTARCSPHAREAAASENLYMSMARWGGLALAGLLVAGTAVAAGNPVQGRIDAYTCMGCHGIPGYTNAYPNYRVPKIGGQNAQYIVNALKEYKNGNRAYPTMRVQANALSEQQMKDIAAFLSEAPHNPDELKN